MLHNTAAGNFACLTLKAYNGRIFVAFLKTCLSALLEQQKANGAADAETEMALLAARTLVAWFHAQESSPRFLSKESLDCIRPQGLDSKSTRNYTGVSKITGP